MEVWEARERYQELLNLARLAGPVALAVVELHEPSDSLAHGIYLPCQGCSGTIQGDEPSWPEDCDTTQVVARALGVDLGIKPRVEPQWPEPSRPGSAYPVAGYPLEVRVQGEHAPPEIRTLGEQGAGLVQVTVLVRHPGGADQLVAVANPGSPGGRMVGYLHNAHVTISLWWSE